MAAGNLPGYPANTPPLESAQDCADVGPTLRRHEQALESLCSVLEKLVGANEDGTGEIWAMNGCRANDTPVQVEFDDTEILNGNGAPGVETAVLFPGAKLPTVTRGCKAWLCGTLCVSIDNIRVPTEGVQLDPEVLFNWSDGGIGVFEADAGDIWPGGIVIPRTTRQQQDDTVTDTSPRNVRVCRDFKDLQLSTDSLSRRVGEQLFDVELQAAMAGRWSRAPINDDYTVTYQWSNLRLQLFCPVDFTAEAV